MIGTVERSKVTVIPAKPKEELRTRTGNQKLRVAAYCRVSSQKDEQLHSYEVQTNYYTEKIANNSDWKMVRIYADEGISGTSLRNFVFVHGWIPCLREHEGTYSFIENWREAGELLWKEARWINGMKAAQTCPVPGKTVVCGHYHASYGHSRLEDKGGEFGPDADFSPYFGEGIIAIDASTANSGEMNLLVIKDEGMEEQHEE